MAGSTPPNPTRRTLALISMIAGALLLLVIPVMLLAIALGPDKSAELPGTLVLVTATGGMALLVVGVALRQ